MKLFLILISQLFAFVFTSITDAVAAINLATETVTNAATAKVEGWITDLKTAVSTLTNSVTESAKAAAETAKVNQEATNQSVQNVYSVVNSNAETLKSISEKVDANAKDLSEDEIRKIFETSGLPKEIYSQLRYTV